jgi:hypothetical protein
MAGELRVALEIGPKGKKVVAVAQDWPGLARGAKNPEAAIDRLRAYIPRYAPVSLTAGMGCAFASDPTITVVDEYPGVGSTDFWGISFAFSQFDQQPMTREELDRELTLMRACWAFFDQTRSRVSAEMARGPRGGGRDRDRIVRHTIVSELDMAKKVGLRWTEERVPSETEIAEHRDTYCATIREYHAEGKTARKWPLRYLIRHTAFHTLDHAWEMEDKDLSANRE